jgi:hypothetical protein
MAEITVDYNSFYKPSLGKITITPRSQGFEWKTTGEFKMIAFTPKIDFSPIKVILQGNISYFSGRFLDSEHRPLYFNEADSMKIYNFLCEQLEWSPEAISEGTAHPNLMAASDRFSTGKRNTRKARK